MGPAACALDRSHGRGPGRRVPRAGGAALSEVRLRGASGHYASGPCRHSTLSDGHSRDWGVQEARQSPGGKKQGCGLHPRSECSRGNWTGGAWRHREEAVEHPTAEVGVTTHNRTHPRWQAPCELPDRRRSEWK